MMKLRLPAWIVIAELALLPLVLMAADDRPALPDLPDDSGSGSKLDRPRSGRPSDGSGTRGERPDGPRQRGEKSGGFDNKHRPGPGNRPPKLTDEQEQEVLDFTQKNWPEIHERLTQMKSEDARRYQRFLGMVAMRIRDLKNMPEDVQKNAIAAEKIKVEIYRKTRAYQEAPESEKEDLKAELEGLITKQFDAEQKMKEYRLEQLAKQLERLKEELQNRAKNRDQLIGERLKRALKNKPGKPKLHSDKKRPPKNGAKGKGPMPTKKEKTETAE